MTVGSYQDWLQRGRTHQWEGRPVDAMLCYRQAASLEPAAADPRYLLGEVQWQLGAIPGAVAAWRDAVRVAPLHVPSQLALVEALLATGDVEAAADAAELAHARAPQDPQAAILCAVATFAAGRDPRALATLAPAIAQVPTALARPYTGGTLAQALLARPAAESHGEVVAALLPHVAQLAFPLLGPLARAAFAPDAAATMHSARPAIAAALLERPLGPADLETLRLAALAVAQGGEHDLAAALARRFAEASIGLKTGTIPLVWPLRTAGAALRVCALLPPADEAASAAVGRLAVAAGLVGVPVEWTLIAPGGSERWQARIAGGPLAAAVVRTLPAALDAHVAAAIAAMDPDVLLDLAGLELPSGALLAARAARLQISAAAGIPQHAPPLVDAVVPPPAAGPALADALAQRVAGADPVAACAVTTRELIETFEAAVAAHRRGDVEAARSGYERVVALQPNWARALHLLGVLLRDGGEPIAAARVLHRAVAAAPADVEARVAAARLARDDGRIDEAIALIDGGLALLPREAALWRVRGELELARQEGDGAAAAFGEVLRLAPTDADAHFNLGVARQLQGDTGEAARAYQRALAFQPDLVDAHFNLGTVFQQTGRAEAAVTAYRAVLKRDTHRAAAYKNLGETLLAAGRIDEWLATFRAFERACPDALLLAVYALEASQYSADFTGLEHTLDGLRRERYRAQDPRELCDALEELLFDLLYFDVEPELLHRLMRTYAASAPTVYGNPLPAPALRRPGRLRIGYLSADLRDHVMGKQMWAALQHHDRERFALHFYSLSATQDGWTERYRGLADRFDVIAGLPESDAARRIAAHDLDLLVDLSGHTRGAKPGILARKPARVQITHVASPGSVGLETVDFKLTDRLADLPASQETMVETLLPMEGCVYPYRHIEPASAHRFHRAALGILPETVVIGAFVTPMKLSRRCLALWRDVLFRVPGAKLAFSPNHPALVPVFERLCRAVGIVRDRILFLPQGRDESENQARYTLVDFVLDPLPYGGVNGVLEPLDAGVPVVALAGRRHGERSAYTILAHLGVRQTIAHSGGEYVEIAQRLGSDPGFMAAVRAQIRAGLAASPLVDMRAHTRHLEAAYLEALRRKAPEALAAAGVQT